MPGPDKDRTSATIGTSIFKDLILKIYNLSLLTSLEELLNFAELIKVEATRPLAAIDDQGQFGI